MSCSTDDLPAPVGPTNATRVPAGMTKFTSSSVVRCGVYEKPTWSNRISRRVVRARRRPASSTSGTASITSLMRSNAPVEAWICWPMPVSTVTGLITSPITC